MSSWIPRSLKTYELQDGDITIRANGKLAKPKRLDNGLYAFKDDTGFDRVVLDCITSLEHGADLCGSRQRSLTWNKLRLWKRHPRRCPEAKLVYNNSPSFNWTLKFREQVYVEEGRQGLVSLSRPRGKSYGFNGRCHRRYRAIRCGRCVGSHVPSRCRTGSRHFPSPDYAAHVPYRSTVTDVLSKVTSATGDAGLRARRTGQEIARICFSEAQDLAGSNVGDDHKEYLGEKALLGGAANTMNQF